MKTVLPRMQGYVNQSIVQHPQLRRGERRMEERGDQRVQIYRTAAEFWATVNLSAKQQWSFDLDPFPRPGGRATRVIYTEYDLPRDTISPHDVIVDDEGIAWYSSFGEQFLGRLDPKTGEVKEYPVPEHKPGYPTGFLALRSDRDGNLWLGNMYQATIVKFDPQDREIHATGRCRPEQNIDAAQVNMVSPQSSHVDGKVWAQNNGFAGVHRLDLATGKIETWEPFKERQGAAQHLRRDPGLQEQRVLHRLPAAAHRPDRRQDRRGQAVRSADRGVGAAARPDGCAGSAVVRAIPRRPHRHVRHQDRGSSRNGGSRRAGPRPMTSSSTRTRRPGPARC